MATRKRNARSRHGSAKARRETRNRILASSVTLFGGILLLLIAFVEGESVWRAAHTVLFGMFGCCSLILGVAVCYLAVLLARREPLAPRIAKLFLGMLFVSGTVIVFSDIPAQGLTAGQVAAACYQNGYTAWISGGALGAVLGGTLLALCGRPAANLVMLALAACVSFYIFDLTPADVWQWLGWVFGGVREKGVAVYEESRVRQAERRAEKLAMQAEEEAARLAEEAEAEEEYEEEAAPAGLRFGMPGWLSGILGRGRLPREDEETPGEEEEPPVRTAKPVTEAPRFRASFDIDLGPDAAPAAPEPATEEAIEIGPGGTFGLEALRPEAFRPAAESDTPQTPGTEQEMELILEPDDEAQPAPEPAAQPARVSAENAAAFRSEPDEDGWIRITAEPEDAGDINSLVAAAMEKPQASEEAAAAAPIPDEPEEPSARPYQYPSVELFDPPKEEQDESAQAELKANAQKLVDTLESFGVKTRVLDISRGPSVTRYEVQPMAGVKISRITSLADDLALNLAVADIRMEAPIPGKPAVGIEVPNRKKTAVSIRSILESQSFMHMASPLTIALGKDIAGVAQVADLCKMPHLLIAGSTGSGKSVCVNSIIMSVLYRSSPEDVKLILIDPKVVELAEYNGIPHLLMPVITEPRKAAGALGSAVAEMERRYRLFADNNVRDIKTFNKLAATDPMLEKLPYIAIIIDELADLMMVVGKDVEDSICRIAQKARAAGMHLIVATQRPSVDVITGLIKANIPSRIAFAVSSQVDSRTILDGAGAEKLLGMGDMLFMPVGAPKPIRIQGTYVKDEEITRVLDFIKAGGAAQYDEAMIEAMEKHTIQEKGGKDSGGDEEDEGGDPMLKQAVEVVIDAGQASTSLLQRRCKLGYARAARIMDEMEQKGIIGPYEGAKPRAVLISRQQWLEMNLNQPDGASGL